MGHWEGHLLIRGQGQLAASLITMRSHYLKHSEIRIQLRQKEVRRRKFQATLNIQETRSICMWYWEIVEGSCTSATFLESMEKIFKKEKKNRKVETAIKAIPIPK